MSDSQSFRDFSICCKWTSTTIKKRNPHWRGIQRKAIKCYICLRLKSSGNCTWSSHHSIVKKKFFRVGIVGMESFWGLLFFIAFVAIEVSSVDERKPYHRFSTGWRWNLFGRVYAAYSRWYFGPSIVTQRSNTMLISTCVQARGAALLWSRSFATGAERWTIKRGIWNWLSSFLKKHR